jgi:hypothetical protein
VAAAAPAIAIGAETTPKATAPAAVAHATAVFAIVDATCPIKIKVIKKLKMISNFFSII